MKKTMTAMYIINDAYGENKITCEAIGDYTIKGCSAIIGKVWSDANGNKWVLWRFDRKYYFVPYNEKSYDFHPYN